MIASRTTANRALSLLLSISFVWVIVACASLCLTCADEVEEACCAAPSLHGATDGAHCPVTAAPVGRMPEQGPSIEAHGSGNQVLAPIASHLVVDEAPPRPRVRPIVHASTGPPRSISVLRI